MSVTELGILGPAFIAGALILASHVPLGIQVLGRGIIFIDLAIAQVAGLGVIAADLMGFEPSGWMVQVSAVSAALIAALFLQWTDKRWPEVQEALIGVCFILAATAGILLLAGNPHGGENLKELLVGQILWVTYPQLLPLALVNGVIVAMWMLQPERIRGLVFYALFAFAVTASVQVLGVYLVFASLIVPALATRRVVRRRTRVIASYLVGISGYVLGLGLSAIVDLPSGAVVVWTLALVAIMFGLAYGGRVGKAGQP